MKLYCTHDDCRAHTVEELFHAMRALPYRRVEFTEKAREIWSASVPCRRVPRVSRTGSPTPPFPPRADRT